MSESGGVPHHSRDALSGSSDDPGTDARRRGRTPTRNSGGKGSSRHSSRRSSGRHEGARLRGQEDSAGVAAPALDLDPRRNSPAPTPGRQAGPEPWALVLDALAELRGKVEALEADRQRRPPSPGPVQAPAHMDDVSVGDVPPGDPEPLPPGSPATFSGFSTGMVEDEAMSVSGNPAESTLIQGTKTFGPSDNVGADIDPRVAEMVNFLFEKGMREDDYKAVCEDEVVKRPHNCPALAPVDCNPQVLEALKHDARKTDFRMREVNKDILRASTILTKSLVALDEVAEQEGNTKVAHEVSMVNAALALLGNANHRNNLARRFVMKREINYKYVHLCSDKVPITRFLFGDDVSQSARQIEETEKLRSKFSLRKPAPPFKSTVKRLGGYWYKSAGRGIHTSFRPYGLQRLGPRAAPRQPPAHHGAVSKNFRGRGGRSRQPQ